MSRIATVIELAWTRNLDIEVHNRRSAHRRLLRRPTPSRWKWSARRLNGLHAKLPGIASYLEIGLSYGTTFEQITVRDRVGVDPYPQFDSNRIPKGSRVAVMTSDDFFHSNNARFDLVFLDGLHTYRQTYRDLVNAMRVCPNGAILIDDVVPSDEVSAIPDQTASMEERKRRGLPGGAWHGDVYRAVFCLNEHHPELEVRTITDGGNPQMLVWKRDPEAEVRAIEDAALDSYSSITFGDAFPAGVPDFFVPKTEADALADAIESLQSRYGTKPV